MTRPEEAAMLTMAVGHRDDVDPADAIAAVIAQCRASLAGRRPQAGILFSAFDTFEPSIVTAVRDAFPGVNVMGSTSAAEISSVSGYAEDSVRLALFASDTVDITVGLAGALDWGVDAACAAAVGEATGATSLEPRVCIMLAEAYVIDPQQTLDAVSRALPDGVALVGGTSARSDFSTVRPTFQFCNERVVEDGVALLLFSGAVSYSTSVGTGWRTIGPKGTVTRVSDGRSDPERDATQRPAMIDEIDGRPPVEFLSRYLDDVSSPATLGNAFAVFEDGTDEYYLRASTGADPATGSVSINGSVQPARGSS
jgi:hypothetical protein